MAKNSIREYSVTAASNTDVGGIGVQGTNAVSNFDGAFRELMSQLADMSQGVDPIDDTMKWCDPADATKIFRFDAGSIPTATARIITIPNSNGTMAILGLAQTFTATQTFPSIAISGTSPNLTFTDTDTGADSSISAASASGSLSISADAGNEVASSLISFNVDGTQRVTIDSTGALNALGAVNVSGALALSSAAPTINFTDTDTGADSSVSASSTSGSLSISADANNEVASSVINFSVDGTQRANFDSTGAFNCLGTINLSSATPVLTLTDTDTGADCQVSASGTTGSIAISADANNEVASSSIIFSIDGATKASIDSAGALNVAAYSDTGASVGMKYDTAAGILRTSQNAATVKFHVAFYNTNGNVGGITTTGTATAYNTSSDYRRKPVVEVLTGYWDRLKAVKPRRYQWDNGEWDSGFIAHEFSTSYPKAVTGEKDEIDAEGKPVYQTMQASTSQVIADIIAALQDIDIRLSKIGA